MDVFLSFLFFKIIYWVPNKSIDSRHCIGNYSLKVLLSARQTLESKHSYFDDVRRNQDSVKLPFILRNQVRERGLQIHQNKYFSKSDHLHTVLSFEYSFVNIVSGLDRSASCCINLHIYEKLTTVKDSVHDF